MGARFLDLENDAAHGAVSSLSLRRTRLFDDVGRPADDTLASTTGTALETAVDGFPKGGRRSAGLRLLGVGRATFSRRATGERQGTAKNQGPEASAVESHACHP